MTSVLAFAQVSPTADAAKYNAAVRCVACGVWCPETGTLTPQPRVHNPTPDTRHPTPVTRHPTPETRNLKVYETMVKFRQRIKEPVHPGPQPEQPLDVSIGLELF